MRTIDRYNLPSYIRHQFQEHGIEVADLQERSYPEETNYIVYVYEDNIGRAAEIGNKLDQEMADAGIAAFIIVRKAPLDAVSGTAPLTLGVRDQRATDLVRLITSRSRVSEIQPSLTYIKDAAANISAVTAPRHHLVFGRRGAGKTALLVEAKRILVEEGNLSVWVNVQTLRREDTTRIFLYIADEICNIVVTEQQKRHPEAHTAVMAIELSDTLKRLLNADEVERKSAERLVPQIQRLLKRFLDTLGFSLYIFIDDFYYVRRDDQAEVLDMLHGCVRDCDAWLKIASIRHLTRWFKSSPPTGLQTGQDADLLDLDVTLQDPVRAKSFLESVLQQYARRVGIRSLTTVISAGALDRLVLASGAVPRDYLVLGASSIARAQARTQARLVGAQDVNQAAGDAAQLKLQELEEDMAANVGSAERTVAALQILRDFCLQETSYTYYRISFRKKEDQARAYNVLTGLMDVRLIHLLDAGVSAAHEAGERFEVFMLDLSQFSGSRLKQGIRVLDFVNGKIVSRMTRAKEPARAGDSRRQLITLFRAAPEFPLERLEPVAE
jgi:AAA ATPase domain